MNWQRQRKVEGKTENGQDQVQVLFVFSGEGKRAVGLKKKKKLKRAGRQNVQTGEG